MNMKKLAMCERREKVFSKYGHPFHRGANHYKYDSPRGFLEHGQLKRPLRSYLMQFIDFLLAKLLGNAFYMF